VEDKTMNINYNFDCEIYQEKYEEMMSLLESEEVER
jgi:hypothetical protein